MDNNTRTFRYDDKIQFKYIINNAEEKLLVFSIFATDFIFTYGDIAIRYYIDNFFNVNIFLISLCILYKIQKLQQTYSSSFYTSSKYEDMIQNLRYEKEMMLIEREKLYKNIIHKSNIGNGIIILNKI